MKSLTSMKAGIISRLAGFLQYKTNENYKTAVANARPIGGPSATQTQDGVYYPTVQSAIDDIAFRAELPVNTVICNSDGIKPGFIQQVDQMAFTGEVTGDNPGDEVLIKVLGIPVKVLVGDMPTIVAQKVHDELQTAIVDGFIITEAEIDTVDATILNIKYNDYQDHIFGTIFQKGITITQTINVVPRSGYGDWDQIGTSVLTLTGGSVNGPITLYYFRRTA